MRVVKKEITFADLATAVTIGTTQPGDVVVAGGVFVEEAFNGTTPVIDVGFAADNQGGSADPNALATALPGGTVGEQDFDALTSATNLRCTVADQITATYSVAGGTPTTGKAIVWAMIVNEHLFA